jgi:NitT/TauT family transport system substrate-binding protein
MHLSMRKPLLLLSCLLLVTLAISGCNSINPFAVNTPTNSMSLNVGQLNDSINFFPFYVAEKLGYFKAQGLKLGARPRLQTGPNVINALEAENIDIGGGVMTDAFDMARVDGTARIIGALTNGYVVDVVIGKKFARQTHLTEASPLTTKVGALRGKKIGITGTGTGTEALLIYLFRLQGLNAQRDATLVNLGSNNAAALAALNAGRVDALSFFSPIGQTAEAKGIGTIFISPDNGDVPGLRGDVHGIFYTRQGIIETKPKAVRAFIRAVAEAEDYIQKNPTQAKVLLSAYLKSGQKVSNDVYKATSPVWAQNPQLSQSSYNVATQFHVQAGLIMAAPHYGDMVAADTINEAMN